MPKIIFEKVPEFGQLVEYVTQSDPVIVQNDVLYGTKINRTPVSRFFEGVEDVGLEKELEAISSDYEKVSQLRPISGMSKNEIVETKAHLSQRYHSDVVAFATQDLNPVSVVNTMKEVVSYPDWYVNIFVETSEVYKFEGNLYQVIQSHTTQSDWTPPIAKSLWKRFFEPSDDPWPWVQPTGAHDAYPLGARVEYKGNVYESTIGANVWSPDVTGWKNLTAPPTSEWTTGTAYKVGDEVTYQDVGYSCLQSHTAQKGWEPPNVPALWKRK